MAVKRTRCPFYGKPESRLVAEATQAFKRGNREEANFLHSEVTRLMTNRYRRYIDNNRRKACNPGKTGRRTSRGY